MTGSSSAMRASGIVAGWGPQPLLRGVDLSVGAGERVAVLGPNGAGKTTLFDVLAGRLRPISGSVHLASQDLAGLRLHQRARLGLGYVPQEPTVFGNLTVRANLQSALSAPARRPAPSESSDTEVIDAVVGRFSLTEQVDQLASTLSGGERRRTEVARTLLLRPSVLLLDEPFAGLDPRGRTALRRGLDRLPSRTAMLITDHAADDLLELCERVVLLVGGAVVFDGPRSDFVPESHAWRRYFGS